MGLSLEDSTPAEDFRAFIAILIALTALVVVGLIRASDVAGRRECAVASAAVATQLHCGGTR